MAKWLRYRNAGKGRGFPAEAAFVGFEGTRNLRQMLRAISLSLQTPFEQFLQHLDLDLTASEAPLPKHKTEHTRRGVRVRPYQTQRSERQSERGHPPRHPHRDIPEIHATASAAKICANRITDSFVITPRADIT